jgi:phosphoribosylaminoimidazolecarboxamide formyltransferase/IMP cyclohydrolase
VEFRSIKGGLLLQTPDRTPEIVFESVSKKPLTSDIEADLAVAWRLCKHVSSNAVVLVKDSVLVGMGAGQPNRVGSAKIAVDQAKSRTEGAVCATDAFLPFPDTLIVVADAGCVALAHTGGSIRDEDSIAAANERDVVLVTTGYRHFRH